VLKKQFKWNEVIERAEENRNYACDCFLEEIKKHGDNTTTSFTMQSSSLPKRYVISQRSHVTLVTHWNAL
jgi:hypothetical protein